MTIRSLQKLSVNQITNGEFSLRSLLKDSLFYPSCDIDGELIRYCNMHFDQLGICSFVYADYAAGRERLIENIDTFRGYHLLATRELGPADVGADKNLQRPEGIGIDDYGRYQDHWQPFGQWAVYERDGDYGPDHGPIRFSLLYLGAEGVAAYSGLYLNNRITPKGLAIIQPGHGFGLNWTDFTAPDGPLTRTITMGKSMPEYIFFGGLSFHGYNELPWPGYNQIDRVDHYYPTVFDSAMTVWQGLVLFLKVYGGARESNNGVTFQILDNHRTKPHANADCVFVKCGGRSYEAAIGTYKSNEGNTLRGEDIKRLIVRNNWRPGDTIICKFYCSSNMHIYEIINYQHR